MRKLVIVSSVLIATACGAQAADLIVEPEAPMVAPPATSSIYVQLLGGVAAGLDAEFYGGVVPNASPQLDFAPPVMTFTDAMEPGWAAAAAVGVVVMDGVSIEADIFHTDRQYVDYDGGLTTTSLMVNGKYTAHASDTLDLYVAAGIGAIMANDTFEDMYDVDYSGFGYQLIAGAAMDVAENVAIIGEVRYQNSFSPLEDDMGDTFEIPTAAALVGVRIGF